MFKIFPDDKKQEIRLKRFFMATGTYILWVILGYFSYYNGLFKVFIDCFDTEEAAQAGLAKIQNSENPDAWLLKM